MFRLDNKTILVTGGASGIGAAICRATPRFGQMLAPEEVAAAVYLAIDESHMVTGSHFVIDCGWTAGK